jgi:Arc/MetJ-type ribon-helix-helix transcriptional regulator
MEIILLAGGNLFAHDESVEITDAVLTKVEQQIEAGEFQWSPEKVFEEIRAAQQAAREAARGDTGATDAGGEADTAPETP